MIKPIKTELKLLLGEDIEKAIVKFKEVINSESILFDEFILMLGRYNDIKNEYIRNIVPLVEKNIELAKIRGTLIKLINELTPSDVGIDLEEDELIIGGENHIEEWEEIGIIEISNDAVNDMKEISSLFLRLIGYLDYLTQKTTTGTEKIYKLKKSNNNPNQLIIKKIIDEVGNEMINYSKKAEPEIILFKQLAKSSIEKATKLVEWSFRDNLINDVNELMDLRDKMIRLKDNGSKAKLSLLHYKTTTEKLPDLTTLLLKGKRVVIKNTDELIKGINDYLSNLEKFIENMELTILEIKN